jgi:hypothetical protein
MTGAAFYPLGQASAAALRVVAREGAQNADALGPALKEAVATEPADKPGVPPAEERER